MKPATFSFKKEKITATFDRWLPIQTRWLKVDIHHWKNFNDDRDFHSHVNSFISIGLKGSYVEETPTGSFIYKAPWIRFVDGRLFHRIKKANGWTICISSKFRFTSYYLSKFSLRKIDINYTD